MIELDITQQRLQNQRLVETSFTQPDEVVRWLGAVQAQEYPGATWGIAQRTSDLTQTAIDQALRRHPVAKSIRVLACHSKIVSTHSVRSLPRPRAAR